MTADGVVAFGPIGNFPRIDIGVLVVIDKPLGGAVKVDNVGIADLLPPPAASRHRAKVHPPDVGGCHLAPFGCRCAVQYKILQPGHSLFSGSLLFGELGSGAEVGDDELFPEGDVGISLHENLAEVEFRSRCVFVDLDDAFVILKVDSGEEVAIGIG